MKGIFGFRTLICFASLTVISTGQAQTLDLPQYAEPTDRIKTFKYESTAEGATPWVMNGTIIESPADPDRETLSGVEYRVRNQITKGIDGYAPTDARVFYRTESDGLFTAFDDGSGTVQRYLQLPVNVSVGDTWQGPSKFWDTETLLRIDRFSSAAGEFHDCAFVERSREDRGVPPQKMIALNVYCPEVGAVQTRTEHSFEGFRSVTDQVLMSIE